MHTYKILAPVDSYRKELFKRLVYSVWCIVSVYSVLYGCFDARLAFWVVLSGTIALSPATLILELLGKKTLARLTFVLSCNAYIYFTSLGLGHQVSAEYYFLPATMIPLLLFEKEKKIPIVLSIALPFVCWILMITVNPSLLPVSWIVRDFPFQFFRHVNFIGAMIIALVFIFIFIKTNDQLKDILVEKVKEEAHGDKILSQQLTEAQKIAKIGSWSYDFLTGYQVWSSEHYKIFEIEEPQSQDRLYKLYRDLIHPDDLDELDRLVERAMKLGEGFVFNHRVVLDNGKRVKFVQGIGKVNKDQNGKPVSISGTCQDRTDLVRVQEEYKFIIDSLGIGIWKWDIQTNSLEWDANMYRLYGTNPESFSGAYDAWEKSLAPAVKSKVVQEINMAVRGEKDFDTTFQVVHKNGSTQEIRSKAFIIKDQNGIALKMWGINVDRNREAQAEFEREAAQKALEIERGKSIRNAKLASLGEMSAGIAHEINNPLAIIAGSAGLMSKHLDDPNMLVSKIETIKKSCDRIARIVSGLRKFSRSGDKTNFQKHKITNIIKEVLILTESKSKRHTTPISVEWKSDSEIICDEVEIEQVLVNLINNAIDAVKKREEKWVKLALFDETESVVLRVIDSGVGIPESVREKLFEPFFTTKKVGEGTGLGLSITKGILDEHKATIAVLTDYPNTCFEIKFPKIVINQ